MASQAVEKFGNRLRLRVCGICLKGNELLVVNHKGLYNHDFWAPPGGGVEFGETAETALKREFLEECGLDISVGEFRFVCEFVNPPLHAVELFFAVSTNGHPRLGHDPEMGVNQLLNNVKFSSPSELGALPLHHRHGIFSIAADKAHINQLRGFYPIT